MFKDQLINLEMKEDELKHIIEISEIALEKAKQEMKLVRKAKLQITRLQDQFDGKVAISDE